MRAGTQVRQDLSSPSCLSLEYPLVGVRLWELVQDEPGGAAPRTLFPLLGRFCRPLTRWPLFSLWVQLHSPPFLLHLPRAPAPQPVAPTPAVPRG